MGNSTGEEGIAACMRIEVVLLEGMLEVLVLLLVSSFWLCARRSCRPRWHLALLLFGFFFFSTMCRLSWLGNVERERERERCKVTSMGSVLCAVVGAAIQGDEFVA